MMPKQPVQLIGYMSFDIADKPQSIPTAFLNRSVRGRKWDSDWRDGCKCRFLRVLSTCSGRRRTRTRARLVSGLHHAPCVRCV